MVDEQSAWQSRIVKELHRSDKKMWPVDPESFWRVSIWHCARWTVFVASTLFGGWGWYFHWKSVCWKSIINDGQVRPPQRREGDIYNSFHPFLPLRWEFQRERFCCHVTTMAFFFVVVAVAGQRPRHLHGRRAGVLLHLQHHREAALWAGAWPSLLCFFLYNFHLHIIG